MSMFILRLNRSMLSLAKAVSFLACALLFMLAPLTFSQAEEQEQENAQVTIIVRTVPEALRRPLRTEIPHFPQDFVIGELGRGNASEEAYRFALTVLSSLQAGNYNTAVFSGASQAVLSQLIEEISEIQPLSARIGGGRMQVDGSISFLVRFIGRDESITGELFLFPILTDDDGGYRLDDLLLEPRQNIADIRGEVPFVFSPHQRFF